VGTLIYLIKQGFENVWKNKIMFIASVLIISTSMITLGIFTIIGENVKSLVDSLIADQTIIAYVDEEISEDKIELVGKTISNLDGVTGITRESKQEAIDNAREQLIGEEYEDFTAGWEESNIFTDSFEVNVENLDMADAVATEIEKIDGIRKVRFDQEIFAKITGASDLIKTIVLVIFVLLVAVSLLVISNTIKLVLHSRRREINIMKYIGATDAFVKTPFIIEGIIVGLIGAYISWFLTMQLYSGVQNTFMSIGNMEWLDLSQRILNTNLIIGIGISCIACMISIKKYLDV